MYFMTFTTYAYCDPEYNYNRKNKAGGKTVSYDFNWILFILSCIIKQPGIMDMKLLNCHI